MKKIIKMLTILILFSCFCTAHLLAEDEYVKVLTPLGHQPNEPTNSYQVQSNTWTEAQIEGCKQAWMYSGGIYRMTGSGSSYTFTKKSNYLAEHTVNCMEISSNTIFAGTDNGIYMSTDYGDTWLDPDEDQINNLTEAIVNVISVKSNTFFAGTNAGIYVSTNSGTSWDFDLTNRDITCLAFGDGNDIYIGAINAGVYKSTDNGDNWNTTNLTTPIYSLKFASDNLSGKLYAGTYQFLRMSTDGGSNWGYTWDNAPDRDEVFSIYINGNNIYIGTEREGCFLSTDGGNYWSEKSTGLPSNTISNFYSVSSINEYDGRLYAATDNGLYKADTPLNNWSACYVKDNTYQTGYPAESGTKMVYVNDSPNDLWIACYGEELWEGATVLDNYQGILSPENFNNFYCITYAFHLSEGGESGIFLDYPYELNYIPWENPTEWEMQNWDYIQTTDWQDPLWDKITYNWGHAGIKSPNNDPNATNEDDLLIESKWSGSGPLVEHKLKKNPYWSESATIRYWTSSKTITRPEESSGTFTSQCIGRQLKTEGETILKDGEEIDFYVAPMKKHQIHLTDGFHAQYGTEFHAYVKNEYYDDYSSVTKPCEIPWEEETTRGKMAKADLVLSSAERLSEANNIQNRLQTNSTPREEKNYEYDFSGEGSGTEEDPFQITNINQLEEISFAYQGEYHWILMNDIDASETRSWRPAVVDGDTMYYAGFIPIAADKIKSLDGKGYVVRNLYIFNGQYIQNRDISIMIGKYSNIKNIGFENCTLATLTGECAFLDGQVIGSLENCFITGTMKGMPTKERMGSHGFVRYGVSNGGIVRNCYSDVKIISDSAITNFAEIAWYGTGEEVIENCYAAGSAEGPIVNSPFGYRGDVRNCFWDNETIEITEEEGKGLGLSTADMMKRSTFESAGWDFENVWYIEEGMDYPKLRVFKKTSPVEEASPTVMEYLLEISPNPSGNIFEISYSMPKSCPVTISITNMLGQSEKELMTDEFHSAGSHSLNFDASALPPGMYFLTMTANGKKITRQMVVLR